MLSSTFPLLSVYVRTHRSQSLCLRSAKDISLISSIRMQQTIDPYLFEQYFQQFKDHVEEQSHATFLSFPSNRYTEENEGYKDTIYEEARKRLHFWEWTEGDVGSGSIIAAVLSAVKLDKNLNNLVDWRIVSKFEKNLEDVQNHTQFEQAFFDFYHNKHDDEYSFNVFVEHFGKTYPVIAYLFFIKDKAQYMPISPSNFDKAFSNLGVEDFVTSHQCSWDNYQTYNALLNQVRESLTNSGILDVSLLNAHSFVWMIVDKTLTPEVNDEKKVRAYTELDQKDRATVVKARIGQGLFRNLLVDYWQSGSVTECPDRQLLIASHIKPWKVCDPREAIDVYNGLLLTPNLDKLFDLGLITFSDEGRILISSEVSEEVKKIFGINIETKLCKIEDSHKGYLQFHRENVFQD